MKRLLIFTMDGLKTCVRIKILVLKYKNCTYCRKYETMLIAARRKIDFALRHKHFEWLSCSSNK